MTQDEFYSKLMQDVEYIFRTGFKLSPEIFMQTMSYASEQYELLSKRIAELEALQAPKSCDGCKWEDTIIHLICMHCSRDGEDLYEPKDSK
jgi:hypothetical protein